MELRARLRRTLYGLAAIAALAASGPLLPLELAVWFSGELLLYLEIVCGAWLMSRAGGIRAILPWVKSRWAAGPIRFTRQWTRSHPSAMSWIQGAAAFQ